MTMPDPRTPYVPGQPIPNESPTPIWGQPTPGMPSPSFSLAGTPDAPKKHTARNVVLAATGAVVLAVCGVAGIGALAGGGSDTTTGVITSDTTRDPTPEATTEAPTTEPTTEAVAEKAEVFEAGTYEVGKVSDPEEGTIKPGLFILITPDHCYWERLRGFGGGLDDIIANDNLEATGDKPAQGRITIKKSDKGLTLSGNCILGQKGGLK
jgi:hypothetical protein